MIGKLEEIVLMACVRAGSDSIPSAIYERVLAGQKSAAFGAVYTTLGRMALKGLVEEGSRDHGGRLRRTFTITGKGRASLDEAIQATARIGGFSIGGGLGEQM
jgi:hypothetical protein